MKTRIITFISILCLLLILVSQAYIVYDHFRLTQESLKRETNAILSEAYNTDLNYRKNSLSGKTQNSTINIDATSSNDNNESVATYDIDKMNIDKSDILALISKSLNDYTSKSAPLNIQRLDSTIADVLASRRIISDFTVRVVNPKNGDILESSKELKTSSSFLIRSEYLSIDLEKHKSLELILMNPLANIFQRMGTLLLGSLLLSIFCLYGLWFLFLTLSRQKQLNAIKNDFFGHTAHELKRPVAQLHMALDALSRPSIDENKLKKERYLAISKEATRDMSEKIGMIMTLSMAEEGVFNLNFSEFDLKEVISVLKEKFTDVAEKEVSIRFDTLEEKIMVKGDKDHLTQSIANLIDNAIKYSKETVQISISVEHVKKDLLLCVKDNGIGIAPDKIGSVFEKYTRLNPVPGAPAGFGIGLSYVKAVIEKHAGHIEVISELTKGSEFKVYLPA
ncbi:MAG: HAMP domain-containing sensor histidine kinase [Bacteroidales bacterium]|nr:HAMP domain-containing sensor histidine kinase [Bacteroidales bacterium]